MIKQIHTLLLVAALGACSNPSVPEGFEGYVFHTPLFFGQMEFRQTLRGPASTGVSWRLSVENIDMQKRNFPEPFKLLTSDNLSVSFDVNTRIQLRPKSSKEIVEEYGGENWYAWNVKEQLRTVVRRTVSEFSATDIQQNTNKLRESIEKQLVEKYEGKPFDIISVAIGHITLPAEVIGAIEQKESKQEELRRQSIVLETTQKDAAIEVLKALRVAKQQRIISETLDPLYVQKRAVDVYRTLATSPNKTIIVLPNTDTGTGMPLVVSEGKRKDLSAADIKLLKGMEQRYMKLATAKEIEVPSIADLTGDVSSDGVPGGEKPPAAALDKTLDKQSDKKPPKKSAE